MSDSKKTNTKPMKDDEKIREQLSAWMDGEDKGLDAQQLADPQLQDLWETYHLIGDIVRDPNMAQAQPSDRFRHQLQERLKREPKPRSRFNTLRYTVGSAAMVACVALVVWAFHTPLQTALEREHINELAQSSQQHTQEMLRQTYETYVRMHTTMVTLSPIDDDMDYIKPGAPGAKVMPPAAVPTPMPEAPKAQAPDATQKADKSAEKRAKSGDRSGKGAKGGKASGKNGSKNGGKNGGKPSSSPKKATHAAEHRADRATAAPRRAEAAPRRAPAGRKMP